MAIKLAQVLETGWEYHIILLFRIKEKVPATSTTGSHIIESLDAPRRRIVEQRRIRGQINVTTQFLFFSLFS